MKQRKMRGRRFVKRMLRAFIDELRAVLKRVGPDLYRKFPDAPRPCHTCAFNPATDGWQGADMTAYTLMEAIRDGRPFYCHENIPWEKPTELWTTEEIQHYMQHRKLCAGYAAVAGEPETKTAFVRAALKVQGCEPDPRVVDLAMSAIEGAGSVLR